MALNWKWSEKVGSIICDNGEGKEYEVSLFEGNAYLIEIYQYEENGEEYYTLHGFFSDKEHAKNCFGLSKGYEKNIYKGLWKEVRLNKKYRHLKELIGMIVQAFDNIKIEVYTEEEGGEAK